MERLWHAAARLAGAARFSIPSLGRGRWLLISGVLVVALASPDGAHAAKAPAGDSAIGNGNAGFFTFDFAVTSGPLGESPAGHLAVEAQGFGAFETDTITCMSVSGNAATIGGTLQPNSFGFAAVIATVVDNGPAGSGLDYFNATPVAAAPTTCPAPFASSFGNVVTGDVAVVDAARRRGLGCGDPNHVHAEGAGCGNAPEFAGLKEDSVTGSGDFGFFTGLDLDVSSGPLGEDPEGHLAVTVGALGSARFETSSITCMSVSGSAATIGGTLEPNAAGFVALLASVSDNDLTNASPDGFAASPVTTAPTVCPTPEPFSTQDGSGDIVVRDAGLRRGLGCGDPNQTHIEDAEFCK
jgi:hypothetical protein